MPNMVSTTQQVRLSQLLLDSNRLFTFHRINTKTQNITTYHSMHGDFFKLFKTVTMIHFLLSCMSIGNHEYYSCDVDRWIAKLPELHMKPLINDRTCILSMKDSKSSIAHVIMDFIWLDWKTLKQEDFVYHAFCWHDKNSVFSQNKF